MRFYAFDLYAPPNTPFATADIRIALTPELYLVQLSIASQVIIGPDQFYLPSTVFFTAPLLGVLGEVASPVAAPPGATILGDTGYPFATDTQAWQGSLFLKTATALQLGAFGWWPVGTVVPGAYRFVFHLSYTLDDRTKYAGR